jgi:hypothetical protein
MIYEGKSVFRSQFWRLTGPRQGIRICAAFVRALLGLYHSKLEKWKGKREYAERSRKADWLYNHLLYPLI